MIQQVGLWLLPHHTIRKLQVEIKRNKHRMSVKKSLKKRLRPESLLLFSTETGIYTMVELNHWLTQHEKAVLNFKL